jgi:hypothetical protein
VVRLRADEHAALRASSLSEENAHPGGSMLTFEKLVEEFRELGVEEGDTLLVHSSYKSLGEVEGGPQTVIRALEAVLGTEGTLIISRAQDLPRSCERNPVPACHVCCSKDQPYLINGHP